MLLIKAVKEVPHVQQLITLKIPEQSQEKVSHFNHTKGIRSLKCDWVTTESSQLIPGTVCVLTQT